MSDYYFGQKGKIAFAVIAAIFLFALLSWLLYFGVTGDLLPRGNNVYFKDSYTMTGEQLEAQRNQVVATLGEHKLTNGQLQVFYVFQVQEYLEKFGYDAVDTNKPLDTQIYDEKTGLTWQQFFLECALNSWKEYRVLATKAEEAGFVLPQEEREYLDDLRDYYEDLAEENDYESADALIQDQLGEGCTFDAYQHFMELYSMSILYVADIVDKMEFSTEELQAYFDEHEQQLAEAGVTKETGLLVDLRRILLMPESAGGAVSDTAWEDCRADAEDLLEQWLASEKSEKTFGELAKEHSDASNKESGGLLNNVYKDYFTKVDVRHILIMPEGGTPGENGQTVYTDEQWEACRQAAQAVYNSYLTGPLTEERFAQLAKDHSKDGNASSGGIYKDVSKYSMVEEFDAWIFDENRNPGDTDLVKTQFGYHIMYFVHRDSAVNDWLYDAEREAGDYTVVKADDGYNLLYFIDSEEAWIRFSVSGLRSDKSDELLKEKSADGQIKAKYAKIGLTSLF